MDRYLLFNKLDYLFRSVEAKYKIISIDGVSFDILDIMISPLYLAAIQSNDRKNKSLPFRSLSFSKKFKSLPKRFLIWFKNFSKKRKEKNIAKSTCFLNITDLLLFPTEPTHLIRHLPIAKILSEKGCQFAFVTNKVEIFKLLKNEGFNVSFLKTGYRKNSQIEKKISDLCEELKKINLISPTQTIDENVVDFIFLRLQFLFPRVLFSFHEIMQYLETMKPRVVMVGNDITVEGRFTTKLCKVLGIRTASIMHGSVAGEPLDGYHIVDNFFLFGKASQDYLTKLGLSDKNLIVTGDPHIDNVIDLEKTCHPQIKSEHRLKNDQGYVLLALSGPGHCTSFEHFNKIVKSIVKFSAQNPDIDIIAKLHRKDNKENYCKIKQNFPGNRLYVVEDSSKGLPKNIYNWLSGCKLVITGASTVAIEAMLMQVPVITVDYMNEYQNVDFIDLGATIHVKSKTELFEIVEDVFYAPE